MICKSAKKWYLMRIYISWLCPFNLTKGLARLVECWSAEQDVVGLIPRPNQYSGFFNSWSYLLFPIKYLDRTFSWLGGPCRNGSLMSSRRHKKVGCPQTPEKLRPWDVSKTRTFNYRRHFPDSFFYQMVITVWKLTIEKTCGLFFRRSECFWRSACKGLR